MDRNELRARLQRAWENHDRQGRVTITMADVRELVEVILNPAIAPAECGKCGAMIAAGAHDERGACGPAAGNAAISEALSLLRQGLYDDADDVLEAALNAAPQDGAIPASDEHRAYMAGRCQHGYRQSEACIICGRDAAQEAARGT